MNAQAPPAAVSELVIASVTPQNLERGVLWFSEHHEELKKAAATHAWWRNNLVAVEKDLIIAPYELMRRLGAIGYERASRVAGRGLAALRGGVVEVWPVNTDQPYLIEFMGNRIASLSLRAQTPEIVAPKPRLASDITSLDEGSYVVHEDHGIGIFRAVHARGHEGENFFAVEYAPPVIGREPDMLFVPVEQKSRLTPYVGFETPTIHRLGGSVWQTTARKAREDAEKLARELLMLYADRHSAQRPPIPASPDLEEQLRTTFPYTETEGQLKAKEEIFADLSSSKPMDRLLCGDVGFGKTELALRAALRVIAAGSQVCLLAPTTILAAQHAKTFATRFADLPVRVAMLSRIISPRQEKEVIAGIRNGSVDCVIGTHRLLSKDIAFSNLGLVIIDEEQRFGVRQKERLKEMRANVDVLSLSATPIPRTLQFTMARIRDISLLTTAPPSRLPVSTFVLPHSRKIIRQAIAQELERGGQVYFLHNRIETMSQVRTHLARMLAHIPRAAIGFVHGRMKEHAMMRVMNEFREGTINILIATTIIENGLDIASANTLICDDATRLGLAEAHQLRGRIGRGEEKAYAYFLFRPRNLTDKASERLETLRTYAQLGAGYHIALRDLEIRGAGNILGREQSGTINKVGLNLYCQMLSESIEALQTPA